MKKLNLTAQEKADVVAFMKALTGETKKVELPTLPPAPTARPPTPRGLDGPRSAEASTRPLTSIDVDDPDATPAR